MYNKVLVEGYEVKTLSSVIAWLNESDAMPETEQNLLKGLLYAAVLDMEAYTHRDYARRDYTWKITSWQSGISFYLPPLHDIDEVSITYATSSVAKNDATKDTHYTLDSRNGRTLITWLTAVDSISLKDEQEPITIKWKAGYNVDKLPANMETGVLLWVRNAWDGIEDDERRNKAIERLWNAEREYLV